MRIARIAMPGALCGESASAQNSGTFGETVINPIDFEEITDVNIDKVLGADSYSHMPGFAGSDRKSPKDLNRDNLLKKYMSAYQKNNFKALGLLYFQKSINQLKSDGEIAIRFPIAEWAESERATEVHCAAGASQLKGEVKIR